MELEIKDSYYLHLNLYFLRLPALTLVYSTQSCEAQQRCCCMIPLLRTHVLVTDRSKLGACLLQSNVTEGQGVFQYSPGHLCICLSALMVSPLGRVYIPTHLLLSELLVCYIAFLI